MSSGTPKDRIRILSVQNSHKLYINLHPQSIFISMKLYLPLLVICVGACHLHANAQQRTMVVTTASSEVKIEVSTETRITFSDDNKEMIVSEGSSGVPQTLDVDDIVNIIFTIDSTTALDGQTLNDLTISHSGSVVTISGAGAIEYAVWNTSGIMHMSGSDTDLITLDLSNLAPGIYIIKANNNTIKFVKH